MKLPRCAFSQPPSLRILTPILTLTLALAGCGHTPEAPANDGAAAVAAGAPRMAMAAKMGDAVAEPAQAGRFMAYEHTLELDVDGAQVATVHKTLETACAAAQAEGCVVLESSLGSGRYPVARVRLRASPAGIKALLARLGSEGQIIRQSVQAEDLAEPMNDTRRRLKMQEDYRSQLEQLRQEKARQELAAAVAKLELEAVPKDFRSMAASREAKAFGWSDRGGKWQATPEPLKQLIDSYNASPKEVRVAVLARLTTDKVSSQQLRKLLDTQKANYRENDQGMSR